jgi:hypothetical protein
MDFAPQLDELGPCPFALATGKPCVLCGGSRAIVAMMRGDLHAAYEYNVSAMVLVCMGLLFVMWKSYVALRARSVEMMAPGKLLTDLGDLIRGNAISFLGLSAMWWVWNFQRW